MYFSYYQLKTRPFQISTDPKFLWLGEKHKEALAVLRYGLLDNKGFLLLTGEVGTGKTTLINALVNTLGEEVIVATILDPDLEKEDFLNYIGSAFNLPGTFSSKSEFLLQFAKFLNNAHQQRKKILLVIDESQRLNQVLLEEIRLLSNIEKQSTKLINIFFVGQKEFNSIILSPRNRALRQRITVNYDLKPLSQKETNQYITHRMKVAGSNKTIFKSASVREIYKFSKGYPRLINVICDRALLTGFTKDAKTITPKIIKECAKELLLRENKGIPAKSPLPNTVKSKPKPVSRQVTPKGRFLEKALYVALALMIVLWLAAAAYFYFPRDFVDVLLGRTVEIDTPDNDAADKKIPPQPDMTSSNVQKKAHTEPSAAAPRPAIEKTVIPALFPEKTSALHIDLTEHNELTREGLDTLDQLARFMNQKKEIRVLIKGYSGSSTGNKRYNKKMSEFTANIVKGFLVGKGVAPQNIETTGQWLIDPESDKNKQDLRPNTRWVKILQKNS